MSALTRFAEDVSLELGKDGEESRYRSPAGRGQIERLREGNEAPAELAEFLQAPDQVGKRASPSIEAPDKDGTMYRCRAAFVISSRWTRWLAPEPTPLLATVADHLWLRT